MPSSFIIQNSTKTAAKFYICAKIKSDLKMVYSDFFWNYFYNEILQTKSQCWPYTLEYMFDYILTFSIEDRLLPFYIRFLYSEGLTNYPANEKSKMVIPKVFTAS